MTDHELMVRTMTIMNRRNIIGVTSGPLVDEWKKEGGDRIIPGLFFGLAGPLVPTVKEIRTWFKEGRYTVLGEVTTQYAGIDPSDSRLEPYLALAEEMDIPVGIHVGTGPPGSPYLSFKAYRARLHSPLGLEEALQRHPKLRLYAMHAGWPMLDDMLAMLWTYPQLYVDIGVIDFALPRPAFQSYLQRIVEAGFGKRVLFGSDQMVWPEAIEVAIQSVETADFLQPEQKRDILYDNAARFLRLSPQQIAQHHGKLTDEKPR